MLKFRFRGKSGQRHEITVEDHRLARILRKCKDIPGSDLFQYVDDEGQAQSIESGDVNDYIRMIAGGDFTAKDFRTWGGTCLAASFLLTKCSDSRNKQTKAALIDVVKDVAAKLGNKPSTCKKYYIHPDILECYASGRFREIAKTFRHNHHGYDYERLVLSLLPGPLSGGRRNISNFRRQRLALW